MKHKIEIRSRSAVAVVVGALALVLWGCSEEAGNRQTGRVIDDLKTVACQPTSSIGATGISYSAERVEDGVAFGWICMGDPEAPVTIVEFASLTCPHCAAFHNQTLPEIKKQYVDTGKARLVFSNYVFNEYDMAASMVVRCGGPDRAFPLLELFFRYQTEWYGEDAANQLAALARRAGINRAKFDACLANSELQKHLESLREIASTEYDVSSTPTFFINGEELVGAVPFEEFKKVIDSKF